jgi:Transposase DDE domain
MVIALIVNAEGFPFSYETSDGNRADVSTLETILRMVERKYGKARRIWVFDRGIVSEENLAAIRRRGGQYLVGTPRRQMKQFEAELLKQDWTQVRPEVEVKKVAIPQGEETYILCRTAGRREKEQAIRKRFCSRMETALQQLQKTIATGKLKDRNRMERRLGKILGKIQARNPSVSDLYEISLRESSEGVRLLWQMREDRRRWREAREGAYPATHQPVGRDARGAVVEVHAVDRGGSVVPGTEERACGSTTVPSERTAGQGPRDGGVSWLCALGDLETSAEAPASLGSQAIGVGCRQRSAAFPNESSGRVIQTAQRRHRVAHHRRPRDPPAPRHRANGRARILSPSGISLPDRLNFNRECSVDSATA